MSFDDLPFCHHRHGRDRDTQSARCRLMKSGAPFGWQFCGKICPGAPKNPESPPWEVLDFDASRWYEHNPRRAIGVGDTVAMAIRFVQLMFQRAFAIQPKKKCGGGCRWRQNWLNLWFPYFWRTEWAIYRDIQRGKLIDQRNYRANDRLAIVDQAAQNPISPESPKTGARLT